MPPRCAQCTKLLPLISQLLVELILFLNCITAECNALKNSTMGAPTLLYSRLKPDRSGSAIHDMLYFHAYVFRQNKKGANLIYGGACATRNETHHLRKQENHRKLLARTGLDKVLKIKCPEPQSKFIFIQAGVYRNDELLWDEDWLHEIKLYVKLKVPESRDIRVALHARRGDVRFCDKGARFYRYTPNIQYFSMIEHYLNDSSLTYNVNVFSESRSPEPWNEWDKKNCSLNLGTPLMYVWANIMTADIVFMAKSSFSYVPAILNINPNVKIYYTPFWHTKHPKWIQVDDSIIAQGQEYLNAKCASQRE